MNHERRRLNPGDLALFPAFLEMRGGYGGTFPQGTLALVLANDTILEETEMALVVANGRVLWVMQDDVTQA